MSDLIWALWNVCRTCLLGILLEASKPFMLVCGALLNRAFGEYCPVWALAFHRFHERSKPNCPIPLERPYPALALNYPTLLRGSSGGGVSSMELYPRKYFCGPTNLSGCSPGVHKYPVNCRWMMGHPAGFATSGRRE